MHRFVLLTWLLLALHAVGCSDEDTQTWPEKFGDLCYGDNTYCAPLFQCMEVNSDDAGTGGNTRCTKPCTTDSDCPTWHSSGGHAVGDFKSQCLPDRKICEPITLK